MRDALSILDQALSLTRHHRVEVSIAEEITGSISLKALDDYVAHIREQDASAALDNLNTIFENGKSMSRFATDLLQYFRDLLVVQTGGTNTHSGQVFEMNLQLPKERLFAMIEEVTKALQDIKNGSHPKVYAEMMTIRLAEEKGNHIGLTEELTQELSHLQAEIAELKQALKKLETGSVKSSSNLSQPKSQVTYKVDKVKIMTIMKETVEDSEQSRAYLDALKSAWNEILDSISPQNRALLLGSEPVLANSDNAILAFDAAFNAEQAMRREDLNTIVGNIMSKVADFSPKIMAVPKEDFNRIRSEFAKQLKAQKQDSETENHKEDQGAFIIPEGFDFLADKIIVEES